MTPDDGHMDGEIPALDPSGPELLYMQIADHIAAQIQHGTLAPGQRLPAERDLADAYGVAYLTIRRATRELRERGLVRSVHGKGTFVATREPFIRDTAEAPDTAED
jgi:GntR family transcriptional regulator